MSSFFLQIMSMVEERTEKMKNGPSEKLVQMSKLLLHQPFIRHITTINHYKRSDAF